MFGQTKLIGQISATALVVIALVFAASHAAVSAPTTSLPPNFTISSSISSSPSAQISALLYPGVQRYLWYTVTNPLETPITVNSLGITKVVAPAGCSIRNLNFTETSFSGSLNVPGMSTNTVSEPISLYDTRKNQDSCENVTFKFKYSGSAVYSEIYSTASAVTSIPSSLKVGQPVVYTATVTASASLIQDPVPSSPTGTITIMDGNTAICTDVPVTSTGITTSTATCSRFAYSSKGTHLISAIYSNTDGNFSGSTSPVLTQVVKP